MDNDSTYTVDGRQQQSTTHFALAEWQQRQRALELSVGLLIVRTELGEVWTEGFAEATRFLEAMPLATAEFRSAQSHLQNAREYCDLREFGAATFELRVVRGILEKL
ncbi:MAG: hypothetical protein AB7G28_18880 [Pirellulales bacterium]